MDERIIVTFFNPDDERQRQQALDQNVHKIAANLQHAKEEVNALLPETLEKVKSAYAAGEKSAYITHSADKLPGRPAPHPEGPFTIEMEKGTLLAKIVGEITGFETTGFHSPSEYGPGEIYVTVHFSKPH